jgi:hypothetical protein
VQNTTVEREHPSPFTLFVMGGQRSGERAFFEQNGGGGGDAWNMTVVDMRAAVPVVVWQRVNITFHGEAWTPRYGHCALHMRVKGYWHRTLNKARIQSLEDSFEVQLARAAPSQQDMARVHDAIRESQKEDLLLGEHGPSATTEVTILLGGLTKYGFRGDVWLSTDLGISWERRKHRAFSGRYFHGCAPLGGNSLIVMGGRSGGSDSSLSDVHRSDDFGLTWTRVTARAGWENRYRFATAVFLASNAAVAASVTSAAAGLGKTQYDAASGAASATMLDLSGVNVVMLFGGYSSGDSKFYADTWATNDGIHWTKQSWDAPLLSKWEGRSGHTCLAVPGMMATEQTHAQAESTAGREVQIRQMPTIVMVAGRSKAERLSDVWVRQGPVVLTNAAIERCGRGHVFLQSYQFLVTAFVALWLWRSRI